MQSKLRDTIFYFILLGSGNNNHCFEKAVVKFSIITNVSQLVVCQFYLLLSDVVAVLVFQINECFKFTGGIATQACKCERVVKVDLCVLREEANHTFTEVSISIIIYKDVK